MSYAQLIAGSIRPIRNMVLVRKVSFPTMTKGGIALPEKFDNAQRNEHTIATVLALGPGTQFSNGIWATPSFQEGDTVVINPYQGKMPEPLDPTLLLVPFDGIMAVWEGEYRPEDHVHF